MSRGDVALRNAASAAYDAWRDYFDADERGDFWTPLCVAMGRLGSEVNGRDMSEPADPESGQMTLCAECGHPKLHHGHVTFDRGWVDEHRCWEWVKQKRAPHGCRCEGFVMKHGSAA